jgi:RNA-splicing ligase RtcB
MSRAQAFKTLDVEKFKAEMADAGIYTTTANRDTLDEAPEAYKNKDDIVRLIEPTATIKYFLYPKMNIKAAEGKPIWKK